MTGPSGEVPRLEETEFGRPSVPTMFENMFDLWTWPLQSMQFASNFMETAQGAQRVVSARLPKIESAMRQPFDADHRELQLMVSEKVSAFGTSGQAATRAGNAVQRASSENVRAMTKLATGGLLWPADWMKLAESNLAAATALATLPTAMLAPLHKGVVANDKRLKTKR